MMLERADAMGHGAYLVTVTAGHDPGEPLRTQLERITAAWRRSWSGRWAADLRGRLGIVGSVRSVEITHGRNGWHSHIHALIVVDRRPSTVDAVDLWAPLLDRWRRIVDELGGRAGVRSVDVQPIVDLRTVADYAAGWGPAHEVAMSTAKLANGGSRTPFDLCLAAALGDVEAGRLWSEYEVATTGRRAIVASRGLLSTYGVSAVDDATAATVDAVDPVAVVEVDPVDWVAMVGTGRLAGWLLEVEQWAADGCIGPAPPCNRMQFVPRK